MLASSSASSAERFRASYHAELMPPVRGVGRKSERWAWFRIAALEACLRRTRTSAQLRDLLKVDEASWRVQLANQRRLVLGGFLARSEDGYRTTERGARVLDDLRAIGAG